MVVADIADHPAVHLLQLCPRTPFPARDALGKLGWGLGGGCGRQRRRQKQAHQIIPLAWPLAIIPHQGPALRWFITGFFCSLALATGWPSLGSRKTVISFSQKPSFEEALNRGRGLGSEEVATESKPGHHKGRSHGIENARL